MDVPHLLTAGDVAAHLRLSPHRVVRLARRGELPFVELPGGELRFEWRAILGWLAERSGPAHPSEDNDDLRA